MKKQYNFSKGIRGKFYNADAEFNLPSSLEQENIELAEKLAKEKKVEQYQIVKRFLEKRKK